MPETVAKEIVELGERIGTALENLGSAFGTSAKRKGLSGETSDVNFYDYDGTLLYSYTAEDFLNLKKMPEDPVREGLTAQGWNWSFEDARNYVSKYGALEIGQMYISDDGKTRIYLNVGIRLTVPLCIQQTVSEGVVIDWGDGSPTETLEGTGVVETSHTYPAEGNYLLTLDPQEDCGLGFGDGENYKNIFGESQSPYDIELIYSSYAKKVIIGSNVYSIEKMAFSRCMFLKTVIIPNTVITISDAGFYSMYNLINIIIPEFVENIGSMAFMNCNIQVLSLPKSVLSIGDNVFTSAIRTVDFIALPDAITSIGAVAFGNCYSLKKLIIPNSLTDIPQNAFLGCYAMTKLIIPESVESIGGNAFSSCYSLKELILLPETPPSLTNNTVFNYMPSDCTIYVPYSEDHSILNAYKAATNWSTYADQMVEMENG